MKTPARTFWISVLVLSVNHPCRGSISVNWLDEPMVLWSEFASVQTPLDMNLDGLDDFIFTASVSFVGVHPETANQYLIYPSPPPNIGGPVEPLSDGFEIGPNSGDGELDWYGSTGYSTLIQCLSGACAGRFKGQHAYMGVEFDIAGGTHYGWIDMYVAADGPYAEIYGWAYETQPGVSILAGAVPEPSTVLLMAAGSLALLYSRARKRIR
jgi:hypothetical protein